MHRLLAIRERDRPSTRGKGAGKGLRQGESESGGGARAVGRMRAASADRAEYRHRRLDGPEARFVSPPSSLSPSFAGMMQGERGKK
jgi:hypothetical protein